MSDELIEFITNLQSKKNFPRDEAGVTNSIVLKLLSILGWDIFDLEEVIPQYSLKNKKVDYCLKINDKAKIFIEIKNINEDLNSPNNQEQLLNYAFLEGIKLATLTNGKIWDFYYPLTEGGWEQRKFFTINILNQEVENIVKNFNNFLLKDNISSGVSFEIAISYLEGKINQQKVDKNLPIAWNKLISEKDEVLIELINKYLEGIIDKKVENERVIQFIQQMTPRFLITENAPIPPVKVPNGGYMGSGYIRSGYTKKKIVSFTFNNQTHNVSSWIEFLIKISEIIFAEKKDIFKKVETLIGKKRKYYSTNKNEIFKPGKIGNTGYYVGTNLSANSIVKLVNNLLDLFGYKQNSLKINCSK